MLIVIHLLWIFLGERLFGELVIKTLFLAKNKGFFQNFAFWPVFFFAVNDNIITIQGYLNMISCTKRLLLPLLKGFSMADKFDEILAAIENLRNENALSHKGLESMIKEVQGIQGKHTRSFDKITRAISKAVMGKMAHAINVLEDHAGLSRTDWHE